MDDDQIDRNIKFAQSVAREYGYEMVAAAAARDAFEAHSKLADRGFVQVSPGTFCREVGPSLVHMVKLEAPKGGIYAPRWGVSLSFVPHAWNPKARYHRTLKSARLDLFERHPKSINRIKSELWDVGAISVLHGDAYMRATLRSMWSDYEPSITDWFVHAIDLESCLEIAREQTASGDWTYRTHYPSPRLVLAFLLAKLGRNDEAKSELALYCAADREDEVSRGELERARAQAQ